MRKTLIVTLEFLSSLELRKLAHRNSWIKKVRPCDDFDFDEVFSG